MLQKTPESEQSAPVSSPESEIGAVLAGGRKSGRRRRLWTVATVVVVALAGLGAWLMSGSGGPSVAYTTQPVIQGDLTVNVTATGTVEPTNEVTISSELSGTVRSVAVDYNDTVKKGQVLAQLDTDKLNANLALAKATLNARKADVEQSQATVVETEIALKRATDLAARSVSSQSTLDTAKADSDRAKAALGSAEANAKIAEADVTLAEADLAKSAITSPIDGVVLSRGVDRARSSPRRCRRLLCSRAPRTCPRCSSRSASTRPTWAKSPRAIPPPSPSRPIPARASRRRSPRCAIRRKPWKASSPIRQC